MYTCVESSFSSSPEENPTITIEKGKRKAYWMTESH
jgi:hypothetical protein